jgi:uncharacterized membrane protein YdbT with pleckstrin-like domain
MSILKKVSELLSPSDPELVEKTLARLNEQDTWNDVFSTKLIELLDKIDLIKAEIRDRLRGADQRIQKAESVTQAESLLLEHAARFGNASERLDAAQKAAQQASADAAEAKKHLERATNLLESARRTEAEARDLADQARRDLCSAREAESRAAQISRVTARFAITGIAISFIVLAWTLWLVIRTKFLFWIVVSLSIVIAVVSIVLVRGKQ